jgi:hypothetical protein
MELVARLFGEAWDHRRQRHRTVVVSLGIAAVVAAITAGLLTSGPQSGSASGVVRSEVSSRFVGETYTSLDPDQQLRDHCAVLNSVACDTLTFQLELRRPAVSVVASMGNRVVKLLGTPKSDGFPVPDEIFLTRSPAPRTVFSGELFPIGTARAVGRPRAEPGGGDHRTTYLQVRLLVTYPDGSRVSAVLRVDPIRAYEGGRLQRRLRAMQARAARRFGEHTKPQD